MMSEQTDPQEQPVVPQADDPPARRSSASRIVLFGILGIAIVVLIFDLYNRQRASAAYDELFPFTSEAEQLLTDEAEKAKVRYARNDITMTKVREIVGKDPDVAADPNRNPVIEEFTFPGFMNHTLTVVYSQAGSFDSENGKPEPYIIGAELDHAFLWD